MISLDQIKLLEQKVTSAVTKIESLIQDNIALQTKCSSLEQENNVLRNELQIFKHDQEKIELGIINALDRLNAVENSVLLTADILQQDTKITTPQNTDNNIIENEEFSEENQLSVKSDSTDNQNDTFISEPLYSEQHQQNQFDIF